MMRLGLIQVILGCLGMNILEIAKRWPIPMPSFLDFHPYDLSIRGLFCPPIECGGLLRSSEVDYSIKLKESLRYLCHGPMLRHNPLNQQQSTADFESSLNKRFSDKVSVLLSCPEDQSSTEFHSAGTLYKLNNGVSPHLAQTGLTSIDPLKSSIHRVLA